MRIVKPALSSMPHMDDASNSARYSLFGTIFQAFLGPAARDLGRVDRAALGEIIGNQDRSIGILRLITGDFNPRRRIC